MLNGDDLPPLLHGHYPTSSLLRGSPPLSGASVLSASRLEPLVLFPLASPARFSRSVQEPGRASRCLHAGCRSVGIRTSTELIPEDGSAPGFDITYPETRHQKLLRNQRTFHRSGWATRPWHLIRFRRFRSSLLALASLDLACRDHRPDFSATFTTIAFDDSSLQWLGISDLIAEPEGPSFISRTVTQPPCGPALLVTQDPKRTLRFMKGCDKGGQELKQFTSASAAQPTST